MNPPMRFVVLWLASITLLAACVSAGAPGAVPTPTPSASPSPGALTVDGKTYLSTAVQGATIVPGSRIRLAFKDGSLSAGGGCNAIGGAYTITGGRLTVSQLMTTEMGCAQPLMAQDAWLATLLGGSDVTLVGDTLTLTNAKITLTLVDREVADPDRPIDGTMWILDGIVSGDTASSVPAGVTASIQITDGRIAINSGCNSGSATVTVAPDTLTFGPIALTKMACQEAVMSVEQSVVSTLTGTVRYTIEADVLTINAGSTGLTFRAALS
jgi:heat shock protein HslJ